MRETVCDYCEHESMVRVAVNKTVTRQLCLPHAEREAEHFAQWCRQNKATQRSSRPLAPDYELVGKLGELAFVACFPKTFVLDCVPHLHHGDGGIDFRSPTGMTIDVKTGRDPNALLVDAGRMHADIYVFAHYLDKYSTAVLAGWATAAHVALWPTRVASHGSQHWTNHVGTRDLLRHDFDALAERLGLAAVTA